MIAMIGVAVAVLVASWLLYPLFVIVLSRKARVPEARAATPAPALAAVVVTRDHPEVVSSRVENLLASEQCTFGEVVVVLDWSVRDRLPEFKRLLAGRARVVLGDLPGGKAAGLNAGMREVSSSLVLLADSWQTYRPDAVRRLLEALADGTYAAVSGRVAHEHDDLVMRTYWRYENAIRGAQSERHSLVTTSGAICVLRKEAWEPIPVGAICDDLFISLGLAMRGHRVGYVPTAIANDGRRYTREQLFQKKVRTLTGLWQLLVWKPEVLLPWRNPIWAHFLFHKLARLLTPFLALAIVVAALTTTLRPSPAAVPWLVCALGAAWLLFRRLVRSTGSVLVWMGMLMAAPLVATYNGVRRDWGVWHQHTMRPEE